MFNIDLKSRMPIYEQLVNHIRMLIIQNVLETDEKLPSVRSLAQELTINPNTIQKAYRELENEGYIYSVPGKGNFVSDMKHAATPDKIETLKENLEITARELIYLDVPVEEIKDLVEKAKDDVGEEWDG
ncbi:GntR family transcriptional regulator [Salinicoccus kekensis]|uniref:GntR family transcriptional regulator n=1 Tax=Salinicoccus kekensis TaxID=714307 RepID=A0A285UUY6_9STAP|nr:GntR family transcriptional regulator [Salinicoccus kekensis]SOC44526.1 GntR family transcriptional regulator [Salinicoccus kekensis]